MLRSRSLQAVVIGCLAALAAFCALAARDARAADTYAIVAQSTPATAGTGRRPLAERIAAANLPISAVPAAGEEPVRSAAVVPIEPPEPAHPVAVAQAAATAPARAIQQPPAGKRPAAQLRMPARTAGRVSPTRR